MRTGRGKRRVMVSSIVAVLAALTVLILVYPFLQERRQIRAESAANAV